MDSSTVYVSMNDGVRSPLNVEVANARQKARVAQAARQAGPSFRQTLASCLEPFKQVPVSVKKPSAAMPRRGIMGRVEPKTFFANERVLLSWLHSSVMLCTLAISLINWGNYHARVCGFVIAPVAIFFIMYSFKIYWSRLGVIEAKTSTRFDDRFGPTALVFVLLCTMCSVIMFNLISAPIDFT